MDVIDRNLSQGSQSLEQTFKQLKNSADREDELNGYTERYLEAAQRQAETIEQKFHENLETVKQTSDPNRIEEKLVEAAQELSDLEAVTSRAVQSTFFLMQNGDKYLCNEGPKKVRRDFEKPWQYRKAEEEHQKLENRYREAIQETRKRAEAHRADLETKDVQPYMYTPSTPVIKETFENKG